MIYGAIGRMRSGKGIVATEIAVNHAEAGYTIVSNMDFYFSNNKEKRTNLPVDFDIIEKCMQDQMPLKQKYSAKKLLVVLDELMILMDSRRAMANNNLGLSYFAAQSAKTDTQIVYTSQLNMGIDTRVRSFAHYFIKCEKVAFDLETAPGKTERYIAAFDYDIIDNQGEQPEYQTTFSIEATRAAYLGTLYKTEQMVAPKK